jgi:alanine racemase
MAYTIQQISVIVNAKLVGTNLDTKIAYLLTDSRRLVFPTATLFFALDGSRRSGSSFIADLYAQGVRHFVVTPSTTIDYADAQYLIVPNVLAALQQLAAYHRKQFQIPVIGITGSNGKTIVKEWLYQLLSPHYNIVRSPRSYNSQIGVPLSVWHMNNSHTLAIFEAGISTVGEMEHLANIIQPTIGVFTNLGEAHSEGFENDEVKRIEKLKLFSSTDALIIPSIQLPTPHSFNHVLTWGKQADAKLWVKDQVQQDHHTQLTIVYEKQEFPLLIPFTDVASVENVLSCVSVMLHLQFSVDTIVSGIQQLHPLDMRMQLKPGVGNSYILNDSYSNDLVSLNIALQYLKQQAGEQHTTVIISDIIQSAHTSAELFEAIVALLHQYRINEMIGIGEQMLHHQNWLQQHFNGSVQCYDSTETFLQRSTTNHFSHQYILLKGARTFAFERIDKWLQQKVHQTVMEINLSAMAHNLKIYQQQLLPTTKVMAMVKAFSYGSGSVEVARLLAFHKVEYLAVAYADEGVELRKYGIRLPIMVMNPDTVSFDALVEYNLEPELYSFSIVQAFDAYLQQQAIPQFPVHIKLDTGMHRLGFEPKEIELLAKQLQASSRLVVKTVFSHLVASENPQHDAFTQQQATQFDACCQQLQQALSYPFLRHLANTAGIRRHPHLQYDMVRLGIGLYGVDADPALQQQLQTVATLKSTIAQIRSLPAGETVGYNRKGVLTKDSVIATVRIGYADGFSRRLGNGIGYVLVNQTAAPVVGSVCMDMIMVDITGIDDVAEGNEVEIFGKHLSVTTVADWCNTIPYEIMTGISQRVRRVYTEE